MATELDFLLEIERKAQLERSTFRLGELETPVDASHFLQGILSSCLDKP